MADQVWDTFLREVAPQVKSAELIAEDNARQNCIGNISSCFQKACKDNIDPNDPDGSYDMCLSRPGTMLNVCKIPLNNCGIDASSEEKAAESNIWDFVVARLAAMRVDSCTTEVKECLQAEDRCGEDYTQCIGLDTDSIIRMCPYDKLTGCQKIYGEDEIRGDAVYDELATMVQGIMLNIDNNFLTECQNAANEAMIKVCGDTEDCSNLTVDDNIGARSLEYKICEYTVDFSNTKKEIDGQIVDGPAEQSLVYNAAKCYPTVESITDGELRDGIALAGVLSGMIFWEEVDYDDDGKIESVEEYLAKTGIIATGAERQLIKTEIGNLQDTIERVVSAIEADPKVQFCMTGREVQGMKTRTGEGENAKSTRTKIGEKDVDKDGDGKIDADAARFPELTKQMRMIIANAALSKARENYYTAYETKMNDLNTAFTDLSKRISGLANEDNENKQREAARVSCLRIAGKNITAARPFSTAISKDNTSGMQVDGTSIKNATLIYPYTDGSSSLTGMDELQKALASKQMSAEKYHSTLRLQQKTKVTFNWDNKVCKKCIENRVCTKVRHPWFSSAYCDKWDAPKETCNDIQF